MSPTIGVFYHEAAGAAWKMLPITGELLTHWQSVPNLGDRIAVRAADHHLILPQPNGATEKNAVKSIELPDDFYKTVLTVIERIYNYSLCDIALICGYKSL